MGRASDGVADPPEEAATAVVVAEVVVDRLAEVVGAAVRSLVVVVNGVGEQAGRRRSLLLSFVKEALPVDAPDGRGPRNLLAGVGRGPSVGGSPSRGGLPGSILERAGCLDDVVLGVAGPRTAVRPRL